MSRHTMMQKNDKFIHFLIFCEFLTAEIKFLKDIQTVSVTLNRQISVNSLFSYFSRRSLTL